MEERKNPGDLEYLKTADLSYLWDSYRNELQNLNGSIDLNDSQKITDDLEVLIALGDIISSRSYNQRLEFYKDLQREKQMAETTENYEYIPDMINQLRVYSAIFLRKPRTQLPPFRKVN